MWSKSLHIQHFQTADKPHVMERHTEQTQVKMLSWLPDFQTHTDALTQTHKYHGFNVSDLSQSLWFTYSNALTSFHLMSMERVALVKGGRFRCIFCLEVMWLFFTLNYIMSLLCVFFFPCPFNPLPHWTLTCLACVTSMITQLSCVCARAYICPTVSLAPLAVKSHHWGSQGFLCVTLLLHVFLLALLKFFLWV